MQCESVYTEQRCEYIVNDKNCNVVHTHTHRHLPE